MERYDQCDDTCTTDCGHYKGAGRPLRMIRALTVRQPWAWAIIHGGKDVENRTRNIAGAYRGPVAIHAGLAKFEQHNMASHALRAAHGTEVDARILYGAVIGVVDLVDVHIPGLTTTRYDGHGGTTVEMSCDCGPWAMPDHHHLTLANPRPLPRPISAAGRLGLWIPDGALQDAIWEQVDA